MLTWIVGGALTLGVLVDIIRPQAFSSVIAKMGRTLVHARDTTVRFLSFMVLFPNLSPQEPPFFLFHYLPHTFWSDHLQNLPLVSKLCLQLKLTFFCKPFNLCRSWSYWGHWCVTFYEWLFCPPSKPLFFSELISPYCFSSQNKVLFYADKFYFMVLQRLWSLFW